LYANNARNFLFINAPPLDRAPQCEGIDAAYAFIKDWNSRLLILNRNFTTTYPDASAWTFDANKLMNMALDKPGTWPQTAGLKNVTESCDAYTYSKEPRLDDFEKECGVRYDEYAWKDPLHITHIMHNLTAGMVVEECFEREAKDSEFCQAFP